MRPRPFRAKLFRPARERCRKLRRARRLRSFYVFARGSGLDAQHQSRPFLISSCDSPLGFADKGGEIFYIFGIAAIFFDIGKRFLNRSATLSDDADRAVN